MGRSTSRCPTPAPTYAREGVAGGAADAEAEVNAKSEAGSSEYDLGAAWAAALRLVAALKRESYDDEDVGAGLEAVAVAAPNAGSKLKVELKADVLVVALAPAVCDPD